MYYTSYMHNTIGVKLSLTVLSSTSIKLNWVHPTSSMNAEIADCCVPNDGQCTTTNITDLSSEQVTVTDLHPFTEYECSIRGMLAKVTVTTFSDSEWYLIVSLYILYIRY